jgi:hypothetical protein
MAKTANSIKMEISLRDKANLMILLAKIFAVAKKKKDRFKAEDR